MDGDLHGAAIKGHLSDELSPNKTYTVQHFSDHLGLAKTKLKSDQFVVANYNDLMQAIVHSRHSFSVQDLTFVSSSEFKTAQEALAEISRLYQLALSKAKHDLALLRQRQDQKVLDILGESYDKIKQQYYRHFPQLALLGALKVPIKENITTDDHAKDVFRNLMVMTVAMEPILSGVDGFSSQDLTLGLLSFGFNHDFLKAAVAPIAGRAFQDMANFPFGCR